MTKAGKTHVALLVDRSGSMSYGLSDSQGGLDTFFREQKAQPGELTVTLYQFDTAYEKVFGPVDIQKVPDYQINPRGGTALLDATGRAITETGEYLSSLSENDRPEHVIFATVTDGGENSSQEWTVERVKASISHQTDVYGWNFVYLSSDLNAVNDAKDYGYLPGAIAVAASPGAAYNTLSGSVSTTRSAGTRTVV